MECVRRLEGGGNRSLLAVNICALVLPTDPPLLDSTRFFGERVAIFGNEADADMERKRKGDIAAL